MTGESRGTPLSPAVHAALREFINALGKAAMYPPGHRFIAESTGSLIDRLAIAMADRDSLTISVLPHGILLDGVAADPLPGALREFAERMHRKNIAVIELRRGVTAVEVAALLSALAASDADETVGRNGLALEHARLEPVRYDLLTLAGETAAQNLDDGFWATLAEAAFGRQMVSGESAPSVRRLADAISERAARGTEGARQVYEALAGFASTLTTPHQRPPAGARHRFVELLAALSRSTTTRVVSAAPSPASRRRFLTETLELVPPVLLMQLLESVAEADGEPISAQLQILLSKLAGAEGPEAAVDGGFAAQVLGLVQQWNGVPDVVAEAADPRIGLDPLRLLALGLEVAAPSVGVIAAARDLANAGRLADAVQLLDDSRNDPAAARTIGDAILDPVRLASLLANAAPDFALIERVAMHVGAPGVNHLLDALAAAPERTTRRHLLDILVRVGPAAEAALLARLDGAPWYLTRNILAVMAQFPTIANTEPVFAALSQPEVRVQQEALKVLVRQPRARDRAVVHALASGEESLIRMSLTALGGECPPQLVPSVLAVLDSPDPELQLLAIRALTESESPAIVPRLLVIVRARRGILRRLRLQTKSPVMLAALDLLARRWSREASVSVAIQLAAASTDADVRAAVGGAG